MPTPDDPARSDSPSARGGLPPEAYEVLPGDQYRPYVRPEQSLPELTLRAVAAGLALAVVFGAANAYLGLRVGLTVSASIPAAVMAVAIFRVLRKGSILETNMVQTIGSAGESLAAGVIFTIPALFIWSRTDPEIVVSVLHVSVIAGLGGILGVLFMIPLRRYLISREHGRLPYPEGTACAEVQVSGAEGGARARLLFGGLGVGALYQALANGSGLGLWNESPSARLPKKAEIGGDFTPELLGVGFIIGPKIAAVMFGGSALAWLVLIPAVAAWGGDATVYPGDAPMSGLEPSAIWHNYIRYVGAGAVGFAGIATLIKSLPTIVESFKVGVGHAGRGGGTKLPRTQQDLPLKMVAGLAGLTALALWSWPGVPVGPLGAALIVAFSFFFVTVSSRIVGLIGSSSNPVSGMTIAALILTALIWVGLGLNDGSAQAKVAVLAVGAVVCISAAVAGDTSQDLKTGFLLGATPRRMQLGEMLGVLAAATVMGSVLVVLNESYGIGTAGGLAAPQATLMSLVIDGVLEASLPWGFVLIGIALAAAAEFVFKLPSLAFSVGLYLPVSLMTPIFVGGLMRLGLARRSRRQEPEGGPVTNERRERGVLFASGLIAGAALVGVLIGGAIYAAGRIWGDPGGAPAWTIGHEWLDAVVPHGGAVAGTLAFAGLCAGLWKAAAGSRRAGG